MLTIYKNKNDIPSCMEYVELNDFFFNQNTAVQLDDRADQILMRVDRVKRAGKFKVKSKFNDVILDVDQLSTGCKTVLNVMYFPDKVFCMKECGENALEMLFELEHGSVYSDYMLIPFNMKEVETVSASGKTVIESYEGLKGWWEGEK